MSTPRGRGNSRCHPQGHLSQLGCLGVPRRRASPWGMPRAKGARGGSPDPPGQGPSLTLAFPSYRLGGEPQVMGTGAGTPGLGWVDGSYSGVLVSICFSQSSPGAGPCESQRGRDGQTVVSAGWGPGGQEEGASGLLSLQDQGPGTGQGAQACASRARTCTLGRQNQDGGSSLLGPSSWNRMWRKKSPV